MEHARKITIHENALTDDYIVICDAGYYFKGHQGASYKLVYYTYANEWGDKEHAIFGRTLEAVLTKYNRATKRLKEQQEDGYTTEELAYMLAAE